MLYVVDNSYVYNLTIGVYVQYFLAVASFYFYGVCHYLGYVKYYRLVVDSVNLWYVVCRFLSTLVYSSLVSNVYLTNDVGVVRYMELYDLNGGPFRHEGSALVTGVYARRFNVRYYGTREDYFLRVDFRLSVRGLVLTTVAGY